MPEYINDITTSVNETVQEDDIELSQISPNAPQLVLGIDEFTFVLKPENGSPTTWAENSEKIMKELLIKSELEQMFGEFTRSIGEVKGVNGYTEVFAPNRPWYLSVNINSDRMDMGVCVRFSAQAWAAYRQDYKKLYGTPIQIMDFLRMIRSPNYTVRLSRIDLDVDYFNNEYYDGMENTIYPSTIDDYLRRDIYWIRNAKGKRCISKTEFHGKNGAVQTLYIGSPRFSDTFLRIYNKKDEQLETKGQYYDIAKNCDTWIRMEAVFRGKPAHMLTDQLMNEVFTTEDLHRFIAKHITDRYRFYDRLYDYDVEFTQDLVNIANGVTFAAAIEPSRQDRELHKSIRSLIEQSGLMSTIYKIEQLYGTYAAGEFFDFITGYYDTKYKPSLRKKNRGLEGWCNKHRAEYADIDFLDVLKATGLTDKSFWDDDSLFAGEDDILHTADVARLLRISEKEVIGLAVFGHLIARHFKGKLVYLKDDVRAYIRRQPFVFNGGIIEDEPEF